MRIVHSTIGLCPERGGPPVVIANLAAEQVRMGHQVCVVSLAPDGGNAADVRQMLDSVPGGSAVQVHVPEGAQRISWLLGRPEARLLPFGEWDMVQIHELWNPFDFAVSRAALAREIPYVITMHGLLSPTRLADRFIKKRFARALWVDRMLRQAWFVHGLTSFECSSASKLLPGVPLVQIANGYSALLEPVELEVSEDLRAKLRGKRFVLFMARLHLMKGTDLLTMAFAEIASRFPDVDLVVAGPDFGQKQTMEIDCKRLRVSERVHFIGLVTGSAKSWLLSQTAAFVLPSRDEGFSVAILEALSMGAPVLITKECHFPEAAIAGAALEADCTPESLILALESILGDSRLQQHLAAAGPNFVKRNYTWTAIAHQMTAAYGTGGQPLS